MLLKHIKKDEGEEVKRQESRYIRDGEGNIQGMQEAAHTPVFKQVFKKGFHSMAAYSPCSSDAEDKEELSRIYIPMIFLL
jgi:hypothetical protein